MGVDIPHLYIASTDVAEVGVVVVVVVVVVVELVVIDDDGDEM